MTTRFSDRQIRNLQPRPGKQYELTEPGGLRIRVASGGTKAWVYVYRDQGKLHRWTLGTYPATSLASARKLVLRAQGDRERGRDPIEAEQARQREAATALTVEDLANSYIDGYARQKKKSWEADQKMIARDVLPQWKSRRVDSITRRDVTALLDRVIKRGSPVAANRTLALVRKMFNYAVDRGDVELHPFPRYKLPSPKKSKDRVLTPDEIEIFWRRLTDVEGVHDRIQRIAKLVLVTGQRTGEVAGLEWSEIDSEGEWWTLPVARQKKRWDSRNRAPHRVPLTGLALALIGPRPTGEDTDQRAFPARRGDGSIQTGSVDHAITRVDWGIPKFTAHDLRRTVVTGLAQMGVPRVTIEKIVNHSDGSVAGIYDRHSYDEEKREALEAWTVKLEEIIAKN